MILPTRNILLHHCLLAIALGLSACVSLPRQTFDSKGAAEIKRIAVMEVEDPAEYEVVNLGGASMAFGLIGGLIQAADIKAKTNVFTVAAKDTHLHIGAELGMQLKEALERNGYVVAYLAGVRTKQHGMEPDYRKVPTDADAILDVLVFSSGYYSWPGSTDYVPGLQVRTRLVSTKTHTPLFMQSYNYGQDVGVKGMENIKPDRKYSYPDFPHLRQNKDEAIEGLRKGIPVIVARICAALASHPETSAVMPEVK